MTDIISVTIVTTTYALEIDTSSAAAPSTITAYTTSIVPAVETIYCGIPGAGNFAVENAIIFPQLPLSSPAVCLSLCLANSACLAVLLTPTNCNLLSQPVIDVFGGIVFNDGQTWYDKDCPIA